MIWVEKDIDMSNSTHHAGSKRPLILKFDQLRGGEAGHNINSCVRSILSYVRQIILTQYNWRLRRHMLDLM
jgi:hypothetical protein